MYYFTIRIFRNGRPEPNIRVAGGINHGIYAGQTQTVYTDDEGFATITWSQNTFLDTIYIEGGSIKDQFYDGDSKTIFL